MRTYDIILAGSSCCRTSDGMFWRKDPRTGVFCHSRQSEKGVCGSCPDNSILRILAIIINRCPLRIHLKMVFLKSSKYCVQVGSFPSLISSTLLILAGINYNKTTVRPNNSTWVPYKRRNFLESDFPFSYHWR